MPRVLSPLEEYLALMKDETDTYVGELSSELGLLGAEEEARAAQLDADAASPDFFQPGDIPAGMNLGDSLRFMGFAREGARRQTQADLVAEMADRRAEILDDRGRQLRDYLNTQRHLSLANQKGVLSLFEKGVVPRNPGLRMDVVPSLDQEGNPVYQQVYKKVDEGKVRTQEIADYLGIPADVADRQITHELILDQKAKKQAAREERTLRNEARRDAREEEAHARRMAADKRRELSDIISQYKEARDNPELVAGGVLDPTSLPVQMAARAIGRQRLIGEDTALQKEAAAIERAIEKDLEDAVETENFSLPTGEDDIEGKQRLVQFVEQRRNYHTARKKLIRGAIRKIPGYEDFGVGSVEKKVTDDWMQSVLQQANSPYGKLEKRTSDLERFFGVR